MDGHLTSHTSADVSTKLKEFEKSIVCIAKEPSSMSLTQHHINIIKMAFAPPETPTPN